MTLSFSTKWDKRMGNLAGKPNYFVEKIWKGLQKSHLASRSSYYTYHNKYHEQLKSFWPDAPFLNPKLHTIREDKSNRWREGMDVHFVINNRTKNRFQFAPVIKCVSVQRIEIEYSTQIPILVIDNRHFFNPFLGIDEGMEELAINDGFPSIDAFFQYFNYDFQGKIIHWTDLKF